MDVQPETTAEAADEPTAEPVVRVDLGAVERDLTAVEAALAGLDDGSYGTCKVCGTPLDDAVLADDPTVLICDQHLDVVAG